MAEISKIKLPNNSIYNIRDDVHIWGGRNLLWGTSWVNSFTENSNITGWYRLEPSVDTLETSITRGQCHAVHRSRSGTTATSWSEFKYYCRNGNTLIPEEQYTLSWWQYAPSSTWYNSYSTNYLCSSVRYYDSAGTKIADGTTTPVNGNNTFKPTAANIWEHRTSTFTVPTAAGGHVWWYMFFSIPRDIDLILCQFKLEHGNKATDWSPAPEDIAYVDGTQLVLLS